MKATHDMKKTVTVIQDPHPLRLPSHALRRASSSEEALCAACEIGDKSTVGSLLLSRAADVNALCSCSGSPRSSLSIASSMGHLEIVVALLNSGADVNRRDQDTRWTPLYAASLSCHTAVAKHLLSCGAEIDSVASGTLWTPLIAASVRGAEKIVEMLIDSGADVNRRSNRGETALHVACTSGHALVVKELLRAGCDVNQVNASGKTPLHIALEQGNAALALEIARHGGTLADGASVELTECTRAALVTISTRPSLIFVAAITNERIGESSPVRSLRGFNHISEFIVSINVPNYLREGKDRPRLL